MAEALVEIVLEQFVSIIRQQAEEGISLIAGAEQEVEKLQSNFLSIQALLVDAENRHVKENAVRVWLDKLKDTSYDIDDVLDEWNTKLQKLKIKKAEDASNPLKKIRTVKVSSVSLGASEQDIQEFFPFLGKLNMLRCTVAMSGLKLHMLSSRIPRG